jgi:hypothetical protein
VSLAGVRSRVGAVELRETWNDRVSAGPPVGAFPAFEGWSIGLARPLPLPEDAVAGMGGKVRVLGGSPPGRIRLPGGGTTLDGNSGTNAVQVHRPTLRCA